MIYTNTCTIVIYTHIINIHIYVIIHILYILLEIWGWELPWGWWEEAFLGLVSLTSGPEAVGHI